MKNVTSCYVEIDDREVYQFVTFKREKDGSLTFGIAGAGNLRLSKSEVKNLTSILR